jgi:hypothetical protein
VEFILKKSIICQLELFLVVAPASLGSIKSQTGRDACIFPVLLHALECPQDLATQFLGGAYGVSVSAYVYVSTCICSTVLRKIFKITSYKNINDKCNVNIYRKVSSIYLSRYFVLC